MLVPTLPACSGAMRPIKPNRVGGIYLCSRNISPDSPLAPRNAPPCPWRVAAVIGPRSRDRTAVELQRGIRRAPQYRADQRRRLGYRARGPRTRPLRRPVVGPVARSMRPWRSSLSMPPSSAPGRHSLPPRAIRPRSTASRPAESDATTAARLLRRSVELAKAARDEAGRPTAWVAASVGPYGAALANGEEYIGRYGLTVAELTDWHRPRLEVLAGAEPDSWPSRPCPTSTRPRRWSGCYREFGLPAVAVLHDRWNDHTRRTAAGRRVRRRRRCAGNRCGGRELLRPRRCRAAIAVARDVTDKPVIVYPNSGEAWDGARRTWIGTVGDGRPT